MRIILSNRFLDKIATRNYPMVSIWYSVCTLSIPSYLDYYQAAFTGTFPLGDPSSQDYWRTPSEFFSQLLTHQTSIGGNEFSKLHKAKYLLNNDNESWISITLDSSLWSRTIHLIFIYAIDYLSYDSTQGELLINEQEYIKNIDNVSAILLNTATTGDRDLLVRSSTNIIKLPIKVECSMYSSLVDDTQQDQVDHYQSSILDRNALSLASEDQFIESYSGNEYARSQIASNNAIDLKGHMTVNTSGLIKL